LGRQVIILKIHDFNILHLPGSSKTRPTIRHENPLRHPLPPSEAEDTIFVSFDDLIFQFEVISLKLALTHETKHIINSKEFEKMKKGIIVVNTVRRDLINEEAMLKVLEGKAFSVGLDVFENEPHVDERLLGNEKIVLSPHIGAAAIETIVS
jgi:glyoxylate reductase